MRNNTHPTERSYNRAIFLTGLPSILGRSMALSFHPVEDGGDGAGGGSGDGAGGGQQQGQQQGQQRQQGQGQGRQQGQQGQRQVAQGQGQQAQGGGQSAPITLSDDVMVILPGQTEAVRWGDHSGTVVPRSQLEGTQRILQGVAEAIRQQRELQSRQNQQRGQGGQGQGQGQRQQQDPFADLEAIDVPTGGHVAQALRQLNETQFSPLKTLITNMARKIQAMEGHVGRHSLQEAEGMLDSDIDTSVRGLKLPTLENGAPVEGSDVLREMARDLFFSYRDEDRDRLRGAEFNKQLKARFDSTRKFFRALEKAELAAAQRQTRQNIFPGPGRRQQQQQTPRLGQRLQRPNVDTMIDAVYSDEAAG